MSTTTITRTLTDSPRSDEEVAAILAEPGFGRFFTDHMVTVRWNQDQGWHDAQLVPYAPVSLDPAVLVGVEPHHLVAALGRGGRLREQRGGVVAGTLGLARAARRRAHVLRREPHRHRLHAALEVGADR